MNEKAVKPKPSASAPWLPPVYSIAVVASIQALMRGDASADQQKRAVAWIVETACGTYDMSFRPGGEEGRRDSDFAEGRRFVGSQIVKLTKLNLETLKKMEKKQ